MNREMELHDSDESDSDFCLEKDAGNEFSEEASSEFSSCSEEEESSAMKPQQKEQKKNRGGSEKFQAKKLKGRKHARAKDDRSSDTDEESSTADTERRRNTRQTELSKRLCSSKEKDTLESEDEDKSRSDALWADFLSDVKPKQNESLSKLKTHTSNSAATSNGVPEAAAENGRKRPQNEAKNEEKSTSEEKPTGAKNQEKHTVIEVLDFAGEEVHVEKVVNADSVKENKATVQPGGVGTATLRAGFPPGLKRPMAGGSGSGSGGLGSLLNQIGKKKKISVLEKSQLDWKSFKQDEGIEEELQTFNKGKDGFLERQDFLQRTDLRQFEIEKNLRQSKRNN